MFGVLSVVSKRFRAVGLIYQQSVEGDSRDPEIKKGHASAQLLDIWCYLQLSGEWLTFEVWVCLRNYPEPLFIIVPFFVARSLMRAFFRP